MIFLIKKNKELIQRKKIIDFYSNYINFIQINNNINFNKNSKM